MDEDEIYMSVGFFKIKRHHAEKILKMVMDEAPEHDVTVHFGEAIELIEE